MAVDDCVHERSEAVALGKVEVIDGRRPLGEDLHDGRTTALGSYAERREALGRLPKIIQNRIVERNCY